jgi:hypothetical protein
MASTLAGGVSHEPSSRRPRPDRPPVRHGVLDGRTQRLQIVRKIARQQRRARGHHAAADVDADGSRNDRALRRDDAADRRALAQVYIRHHRQVPIDEGHSGGVDQLLAGFVLDRNILRPHLDRLAIFDFEELIVHFRFLSLMVGGLLLLQAFLLNTAGL